MAKKKLDSFFLIQKTFMFVNVNYYCPKVSLVRAEDSRSRGRGFESRHILDKI